MTAAIEKIFNVPQSTRYLALQEAVKSFPLDTRISPPTAQTILKRAEDFAAFISSGVTTLNKDH